MFNGDYVFGNQVDNRPHRNNMERMMNCKSCTHCRELKKDFIQGKGFTITNCCIALANEKDGFVLEVTAREFCEMYREKDT